jgi:rhodanese-related sulfurtransferase
MSEHAHEIVRGLWLGNRFASQDLEFLNGNKITCVFNCTKDLPFHSSMTRRYRVPVDDNLQKVEINNLARWAPEIVFKIIHELKQGNNVLVHCAAGMQRSAAAVAMTLIAAFRMPKDHAMRYIRTKRPVAFFPAANFDAAIEAFETQFKNAIGHK